MDPASDSDRRQTARALLKWFSRNKRDFPWRKTFSHPDPYLILFTEIMLQRTRADQVVPVYLDFCSKYPSFQQLSKAPEADVHALFSRLGLKWRARNVLRLVRVLEAKHSGVVPSTVEELVNLPAVGDYVAKAVACYAFGENVAPIDSNVVRVVSRLVGLTVKGDSTRRNKEFSRIVQSLVPKKKAREFNLALLDHAAVICRPRPLCHVCPVNVYCEYFRRVRKLAS